MMEVRIQKCLRCGYCCRKRPCPYGKWDKINKRCEFLVKDGKRFKCSKYDEITALPEDQWKWCPAFGAGCPGTLFNTERQKVWRWLRTMRVKFYQAAARLDLTHEQMVEALLDYIEEELSDQSFEEFMNRLIEEGSEHADGGTDQGEGGEH